MNKYDIYDRDEMSLLIISILLNIIRKLIKLVIEGGKLMEVEIFFIGNFMELIFIGKFVEKEIYVFLC